MLTNLKEIIQDNFSAVEMKIWMLVIIGFISYFAGRIMGTFYSHIINS